MKTTQKLRKRTAREDQFLKQAKALVERLKRDRDELRTLLEEYGDIADSADRAIEAFDDGVQELSTLI